MTKDTKQAPISEAEAVRNILRKALSGK